MKTTMEEKIAVLQHMANLYDTKVQEHREKMETITGMDYESRESKELEYFSMLNDKATADAYRYSLEVLTDTCSFQMPGIEP